MPLSRDAFQELMRETFDQLLHINDTKGHDYAGEANALANFEEEAAVLGVDPETVWAVFAGKHWRSIMTFCKEGDVQSEPIRGRVHDLIMYGFLLLGLIEAARLRDMKNLDGQIRDQHETEYVERADDDGEEGKAEDTAAGWIDKDAIKRAEDEIVSRYKDRDPEQPWVLQSTIDGSFFINGEIHTPFQQDRVIHVISVPRGANYQVQSKHGAIDLMRLAHALDEAQE